MCNKISVLNLITIPSHANWFFLRPERRKNSGFYKRIFGASGRVTKNITSASLDDFYYLARIILLKDEAHFDKFDQAFGFYFKGIDTLFDLHPEIPLDWLKKRVERELTDEQKAAIEKFGYDKLMDRLNELLKEQKERHEGGKK